MVNNYARLQRYRAPLLSPLETLEIPFPRINERICYVCIEIRLEEVLEKVPKVFPLQSS